MKWRTPALGLALASTAPVAAQTPAPSPVPAPSAGTPSSAPASVAPTAAASPGYVPLPGTASPAIQTPAPTPAPTATPVYRYVYRPATVPTPAPDPNTPQIAEIDLTDSTIVTPGEVHVRVLTSYAVTNVVAQALGRQIAIPRSAPGLFLLDTSIPNIPFFMSYLKNRIYPIVFIAGVPDGRTTAITLSITLK